MTTRTTMPRRKAPSPPPAEIRCKQFYGIILDKLMADAQPDDPPAANGKVPDNLEDGDGERSGEDE